MKDKTVDFLVIGAGLAGYSLALKLAEESDVLLVAKGDDANTASGFAQGGVAAASLIEDSTDLHAEDTRKAGSGLNHSKVVDEMVKKAPDVVKEWTSLGVKLSRNGEDTGGEFHLHQEGGHSKRRIFHAEDATGKEVMRAYSEAVHAHPRITIRRSVVAIDLLTKDKISPSFTSNRCLGAYLYDEETGNVEAQLARVTILATGGHGKIYLYTSNPDSATGDGLAMAWRAGCKVANLEFMQFHPTCFYSSRDKNFLISEAVRGEGAVIRNEAGEDFVKRVDDRGSMAPRDVVARAIDLELKKTGKNCVFLDFSPIGTTNIEKIFPTISAMLKQRGVDPVSELVPIVPAAHYSCGGIIAESNGRTQLDGLFAVGEVACTGFHGANRLASNSLLEANVMAQNAAQTLIEMKKSWVDTPCPVKAGLNGKSVLPWHARSAVTADELVLLSHAWDEVRRIMSHYVGIVRSDMRLKRAYDRISQICHDIDEFYWNQRLSRDLIELRNLSQIALLTVRCAMSRKESRGIHFNLDHPERDDEYFSRDTVLR